MLEVNGAVLTSKNTLYGYFPVNDEALQVGFHLFQPRQVSADEDLILKAVAGTEKLIRFEPLKLNDQIGGYKS